MSGTTKALRGHQVVEALRDQIIEGRFEPGERLIETALADQLGTSRGPIRDALRLLENEGLVMSVPYRGAVVLGVSDEEVEEVIIPIRLVLERYCFARALELLTDDEYAELGRQLWLMEHAAQAGDLARVVEADLRFHDVVISTSGQPHTVNMWRSIQPRIRAYFYRYGRGASLQAMVDEHRQLLDALQTRDPNRVLPLLERHLLVRTPPDTRTRARRRRDR